MTRQFVLICSGIPYVADRLPDNRFRRSGLMKEVWKDLHAFDGESHFILVPQMIPEFGVIARLLASTVYDPVEPVTFTWERNGAYDKAELIRLVEQGLARDDDIIQQWFDAGEVLQLMTAAESWQQMVLAVQAVCGGHDVMPDVREYAASVLGAGRLAE